MENEQAPDEVFNETEKSFWNSVTPFSKYLAMSLFIALPFIGGYVGYTFAPEKVIEIEKTVEVEIVQEEPDVEKIPALISNTEGLYRNDTLGFTVIYPDDWRVDSFENNSVQFFNYPESKATFSSRWPVGANKVEGLGGVVVNLDDVENLSEYSLVTQSELQFYRLDPSVKNENRWISILIPYPEDLTKALRFAVYGDANTREEMLDSFLNGFSLVESNNSYRLTFNEGSFHISTTSSSEGVVLFESDKQINFYLPWFSQDESVLRKTDGSKVNDKYYFDIWTQTSDEPSYEWELAEYDSITGEFRILLDSEYLQLDETYNRDKAMSLAPSENLLNDLGHLVFRIVLCTECGPGPQHYWVLNYETLEFTLIGRATQIEWVDSSMIRYKTESEYGVSKLDATTKEFLKQHENECIDHPINCFQQVDWEQIPWQEVSI